MIREKMIKALEESMGPQLVQRNKEEMQRAAEEYFQKNPRDLDGEQARVCALVAAANAVENPDLDEALRLAEEAGKTAEAEALAAGKTPEEARQIGEIADEATWQELQVELLKK